jgi:hypothetical protein
MAKLESTAIEKDWCLSAVLGSGHDMATRLPDDIFEDFDS